MKGQEAVNRDHGFDDRYIPLLTNGYLVVVCVQSPFPVADFR